MVAGEFHRRGRCSAGTEPDAYAATPNRAVDQAPERFEIVQTNIEMVRRSRN
jgi:hypothetical protein